VILSDDRCCVYVVAFCAFIVWKKLALLRFCKSARNSDSTINKDTASYGLATLTGDEKGLAFWPTLTYFWFWPTFADSDTQLYDRSKIIHISKAITTTVKQPSKLVHFEVLKASSPTNMTLTLWKSVKVAWPNFRLSLLARILIYVRRSCEADLYVSPIRCTHSDPDDLGLFSSQWHTFKEKTLKSHISETVTTTATSSRTVIQLGMVLQVWNRGLCDLDLRKKVISPWRNVRLRITAAFLVVI